MNITRQNPKWWQLYLTLPLLIGLFALDGRLRISSRGHQVVQIGIILLVYGMIHVWLRANARALSRMDQRQNSKTFRVMHMPPEQLSYRGGDQRSTLQLPGAEIKGMLSDAFEMNVVDAETLPVDKVSQNSNKE